MPGACRCAGAGGPRYLRPAYAALIAAEAAVRRGKTRERKVRGSVVLQTPRCVRPQVGYLRYGADPGVAVRIAQWLAVALSAPDRAPGVAPSRHGTARRVASRRKSVSASARFALCLYEWLAEGRAHGPRARAGAEDRCRSLSRPAPPRRGHATRRPVGAEPGVPKPPRRTEARREVISVPCKRTATGGAFQEHLCIRKPRLETASAATPAARGAVSCRCTLQA